MPRIAVDGAGLGGAMMASEIRHAPGTEREVAVASQGTTFAVAPSNPRVAAGCRAAVAVDLVPVFARRGIALHPQRTARVHPETSQIDLTDGTSLPYDYLATATGPDLASDEVEGLGPQSHLQPVCQLDHAVRAKEAFGASARAPGPMVIGPA